MVIQDKTQAFLSWPESTVFDHLFLIWVQIFHTEAAHGLLFSSDKRARFDSYYQ